MLRRECLRLRNELSRSTAKDGGIASELAVCRYVISSERGAGMTFCGKILRLRFSAVYFGT